MRVLASSDLHVDYLENKKWLSALSDWDYQDDAIIVAGDLTDNLGLLQSSLAALKSKFRHVYFVPGNHELWVVRDDLSCSIEKFEHVMRVAEECGVQTHPHVHGSVSIVPMFSWYDYSFGQPGKKLQEAWSDFYACQWPEGMNESHIAEFFAQKNQGRLKRMSETVISFSHFLPRIDVMPSYIPERQRFLYPVLGGKTLGDQVSTLRPDIHLYGHSHVNQTVSIDGITYINNAHGYPAEKRLSSKRLKYIYGN